MAYQFPGTSSGPATAGTAPFLITGAAGASPALDVNPTSASGNLFQVRVNSGTPAFSINGAGIPSFGGGAYLAYGQSIGGSSGGYLVLNSISPSWELQPRTPGAVSAEYIGNQFDGFTLPIGGGFAAERFNVFTQPTVSGAFTVTNAATVAIAGAPIAAGGATLTNAYALWIQGGDIGVADATIIRVGNGGQIGMQLFTSQTRLGTKLYPSQDGINTQTTAGIYGGTGVPSNANGNNGDFYFRGDTPGTAGQRLYIKSAAAWVATTL